MLLRTSPNAQPARLLVAVAALGVFWCGLRWLPAPREPGNGLNPETARALQEESAVMRRYGKWSRALQPTLKLHAAFPESHIYLAQLAEIYEHLGRYREEAAAWEEFWVRAPMPIEACPQIAESYREQGLPQRAIEALERCLALAPDSPDQIFYLARAVERNGDADRAATLYTRGLAIKPDNSDLAIGLARVLLRQGKLGEARALAGNIVARSPKDPDALLVLGLVCAREGRRVEAREYLERGVQAADRYADLHLALANLAEQDANLNLAILQYRRVTELDKSNDEAARRLQVLERAHP
jgi:tetratricopeptide (TPR) repeat protein